MPSASAGPLIRVREEVATLKRERTIDVAAELFYERGYENTSLDLIAEQMSVTKPFIYAHFASKAELLAEICARGIASALEALDGVLETSGSPSDRMAEICRRFVTAVLHSQRHIAIFAREEKNLAVDDFERISDMRREFDSKLVWLLDEGVAAGEFHIDDTRIAALAFGGMVSWAYVWYRPDGRLTLDAIADAMAALVLGMLGAPAATKVASRQAGSTAAKRGTTPKSKQRTVRTRRTGGPSRP